jgi:hypothetical protein
MSVKTWLRFFALMWRNQKMCVIFTRDTYLQLASMSDITNIVLLDIVHRPVFIKKHRPVYFSKHNVSETGFCLRLQVLIQSPKRCVLKNKLDGGFR